ncbi:DUF2157 domain-containing protein [Shewanella litorisediminis]|uniref:DUF2157 domain-containing protein n=1 Tax=Shewanella litorisediminis TaxID=1173586 RepID=A0ABX7G7D5_9GAMM|nr:DUF2157 domain-containing protein [Shewanella litorisediminis]MCL2916633.1 DUF2157 domain-containing protein [Shewanella litorisediminis]QRH03189.1 DUF2157 domain-containing protein [Shewanella litorisediminis]
MQRNATAPANATSVEPAKPRSMESAIMPESPSVRALLTHWLDGGLLSPGALSQLPSLVEAYEAQHPQHWVKSLCTMMLYLGALSLGAGIIFFFAYNWASLHHVAKFALVESAIVLTLLGLYLCVRQKRENPLSAWLTGALLLLLDLLVGALLALVGQVYQTGADPWQLFAIWATFTLLPALAYRSDLLWSAFWAQANLALWLHFASLGSLWGIVGDVDAVMLAIAIANLGLHWLLEVGQRRRLALLIQPFTNTLALTAGVAGLAWYGAYHTLDNPLGWYHGVLFVVLLALLPLIILVYRRWCPRVTALGIWGFAVIAVSSILLARVLFESSESEGSFLLVGWYVIGCSSGLAIYLKGLLKTEARQEAHHGG